MTVREGEFEPEYKRGGRASFVQFQQELFVPFQTGVTWQWRALTNNQRHQNITIKVISQHAWGAFLAVTLK